jgi:hypothetical protein
VDENGVCYLGDSKNTTHEFERRHQIVLRVLDVLQQDVHEKHPEIDHRDDVLKIFAIPGKKNQKPRMIFLEYPCKMWLSFSDPSHRFCCPPEFFFQWSLHNITVIWR